MCFKILSYIAAFSHLIRCITTSSILGSRALPGTFPAFVLIRNVDDAPLCGGALVESRHVVSSAYCFTEKQNIEKLEIMAGEVTDSEHFGPTRQVRRVIRMMRHQSIGSHNGKFDILVLRPFTRNVYLQPIPMAAFDLNMGSACSLVTWDKKFSKVGIHVVRYTTIFTKHQSGCAIKDKNIFCAGKESEVNGILGYVGALLIHNNILYGIYLGPGSMKHSKPGIFANIYNLREWIINAIMWNGTGPVPDPVFRKVSQVSGGAKLSFSWKEILLILVYVFLITLFSHPTFLLNFPIICGVCTVIK
ncbi:trypsin-3-like isoform X2 [Hermetia illucens]|uniref:trypsin-3-like isoform X2 n=1 Tax=Hermetia illucens TaxID=343691 RepID=UPI0018CBFA32|nr:trypsin-3-like isoform X2 [Hermetia illucens]